MRFGSNTPTSGQHEWEVRCVSNGRTRKLFVFATVASQAVNRARALLRSDYGLDPDDFEYEATRR